MLCGDGNVTSETTVHRGSKLLAVSDTYARTLWLRLVRGGDQKLSDWSDKMRAQALTTAASARILSKHCFSPHIICCWNTLIINWRVRQDLNLQPSDPKSEALSN